MRESREVIQPLIQQGLDERQMDEEIRRILLEEEMHIPIDNEKYY